LRKRFPCKPKHASKSQARFALKPKHEFHRQAHDKYYWHEKATNTTPVVVANADGGLSISRVIVVPAETCVPATEQLVLAGKVALPDAPAGVIEQTPPIELPTDQFMLAVAVTFGIASKSWKLIDVAGVAFQTVYVGVHTVGATVTLV
jgi:hypothetical protein